MSKQFREQGGAATMDPNPILRWITSRFMTATSSESSQLKQRNKAEQQRIKSASPHQIEYFHQVDDGYSHLAAQTLEQIVKRYDIRLKCYLVSGPTGANAPEPELLLKLSRYDAFHIAPYYGLQFPQHDGPADPDLMHRAQAVIASLLAGKSSDGFVAHAAEVGQALWNNDQGFISELEQKLGFENNEKTKQSVAKGNDLRSELGHYSGAMFYYAGEWYWGVDRLYHLEQRLTELGLDRTPNKPLIAPRRSVESGPLLDDGSLTLEIYGSLRSPYTAVAFDQTVALAKKTGVTLKLLPVLPMVMRGAPMSRIKGKYILFDTGREARAAKVPFGPCFDPIGEPTRRAYSLLKWAAAQGKEIEFFSSFLKCAWIDAINVNSDRGMQKMVERAGLDWSAAKQIIGNSDWQEGLETNRLAMYEHGLWGVPSFRLIDQHGEQLLALWGQDRLWIMAAKIQQTLQQQNIS
ncbi:MAG: 2-hydroxychromene-2-carboxylate isomerase [Cryomorphaceae bacterium]|jgi:2-hydroxychromene-2-carboxylate isomerase